MEKSKLQKRLEEKGYKPFSIFVNYKQVAIKINKFDLRALIKLGEDISDLNEQYKLIDIDNHENVLYFPNETYVPSEPKVILKNTSSEVCLEFHLTKSELQGIMHALRYYESPTPGVTEKNREIVGEINNLHIYYQQ